MCTPEIKMSAFPNHHALTAFKVWTRAFLHALHQHDVPDARQCAENAEAIYRQKAIAADEATQAIASLESLNEDASRVDDEGLPLTAPRYRMVPIWPSPPEQ
jgi:hypothetical protein